MGKEHRVSTVSPVVRLDGQHTGEFPRHMEERHSWEIGDVGPEHIAGIRDLFRTLYDTAESRN